MVDEETKDYAVDLLDIADPEEYVAYSRGRRGRSPGIEGAC